MPGKDLSKLLRDESYLNYCFGRNAADIRYWEKWLEDNPDQREEVEELKKLAIMLVQETMKQEAEEQYAILRQQINAPRDIKAPRPVFGSRFLFRLGIAASIAICSAAVFFTVFRHKQTEQIVHIENKAEILPGGNKAFLTLADGTRISLSDAADGGIASQSGTSISKAGGQLVYTTSAYKLQNDDVEYNTIETPAGGQYEIHLPDGSTVWLNAASSLKYPVSFASLKNRSVELSGEAYFEIAKDKNHPFIVTTPQQEVEVLGTHFNINAYDDEPAIKTTLLEGSVKVTNSTHSTLTLIPGQQSVVKNGKISRFNTDTNEAVAWRKGDFDFNSEQLGSIMRKLSRWYNIEVVFEGDVQSKSFTGKISRFKNLSQVLKMLSKTKAIHFKVQERRVIVSERKGN